jgi:hypothetical protein
MLSVVSMGSMAPLLSDVGNEGEVGHEGEGVL